MGFDSSNGNYGIADNLIFADNNVFSGCRDLFRVSGQYVNRVSLVGNTFSTTSHPKMAFFTNPNVTVYSAGNTWRNSNTRFYYTANIKNHFSTKEFFYNLTASGLGANCYQYDTTPQNVQISDPTYDSSIQTLLHLSSVAVGFFASGTPTLPVANTGITPPTAFNFSVIVQNTAKVGLELTLAASTFLRYVAISNNRSMSLVAVYHGLF
jgi:hypothetical protein